MSLESSSSCCDRLLLPSCAAQDSGSVWIPTTASPRLVAAPETAAGGLAQAVRVSSAHSAADLDIGCINGLLVCCVTGSTHRARILAQASRRDKDAVLLHANLVRIYSSGLLFADRVGNRLFAAFADIFYMFIQTGKQFAITHHDIAAKRFDLGLALLSKVPDRQR